MFAEAPQRGHADPAEQTTPTHSRQVANGQDLWPIEDDLVPF
jgi:hypothetical protein